jgi:hypothetical protein
MKTYLANIASIFAFTVVSLHAQEPPSTVSPAQSPDAAHFHGVDERGDKGMGFSHKMTGHHFHLLADGGAIEVEANNPSDASSQKAIQQHMTMIAGKFSQGDFSLPMFIHATNPPGMETMKRLKHEITYAAENTARGAQVKITTKNPEAVNAIHEFLRFQITEHRTNDPLTVEHSY